MSPPFASHVMLSDDPVKPSSVLTFSISFSIEASSSDCAPVGFTRWSLTMVLVGLPFASVSTYTVSSLRVTSPFSLSELLPLFFSRLCISGDLYPSFSELSSAFEELLSALVSALFSSLFATAYSPVEPAERSTARTPAKNLEYFFMLIIPFLSEIIYHLLQLS